MLFCAAGMPCACAPGFKGETCDQGEHPPIQLGFFFFLKNSLKILRNHFNLIIFYILVHLGRSV